MPSLRDLEKRDSGARFSLGVEKRRLRLGALQDSEDLPVACASAVSWALSALRDDSDLWRDADACGAGLGLLAAALVHSPLTSAEALRKNCLSDGPRDILFALRDYGARSPSLATDAAAVLGALFRCTASAEGAGPLLSLADDALALGAPALLVSTLRAHSEEAVQVARAPRPSSAPAAAAEACRPLLRAARLLSRPP